MKANMNASEREAYRRQDPVEVPPHPVVAGKPVLIGDRLILRAGNQTLDYLAREHGYVGTVIELRLVQNPSWTHPESGTFYEEKNEVWIELGGHFRSIIFKAEDFGGRE